MKKRLFSLFVATCMVMTLLPMSAFADEPIEYQAQIGDKQFATLGAAIEAADDGDTVELLANITLPSLGVADIQQEGVITIDKNITLDGKGHSITTTADEDLEKAAWAHIIQIADDAEVNIKNLKLDGTQDASYGIDCIAGTKAILDEVTLTNFFDAGLRIDSATVEAGTLNISGCKEAGVKLDGEPCTFTWESGNITDVLRMGENASWTAPDGWYKILYADGVRYTPTAMGVYLESTTSYYASFDLALGASENKDTLKLMADLSDNFTISEKKEITIDLNGKTLTGLNQSPTPSKKAGTLTIHGQGTESEHTIENEGTLTIHGKGTVVNEASSGSALGNTGTAIIQNGTFSSNYMAIFNTDEAKLTIDDGTFSGVLAIANAGSLTVKGGTFSGDECAISNEPNGKLIIENGAFKGTNCAIGNSSGTVAINNGAFKSPKHAIMNNGGTVTITGGLFSSDVTYFVEAGYAVFPSGNTELPYEVREASILKNIVVTPGATVATLAEDLPEALDDNYVKLLEQTLTSEGLLVEANQVAADITQEDFDEAVEALEKELGSPLKGSDVTLYVLPYFTVHVTGATTEEEGQITTLTLDITPRVKTIASTAKEAEEILLDVEEINAVLLDDVALNSVITQATISIALPTEFNSVELQVRHVKDNGSVYYYEAEVEIPDGPRIATFTAIHGFSTFRLEEADDRELTIIYDSDLESVIYTITDVGTKLPTVSKSGYDFNGWIIEDNTYTTLTEGMWNTLMKSEQEDIEVNAIADFSRESSGGSSTTRYSIKSSAGKGGSISPSGSTSVKKGDDLTFTIWANKGYAIDEVLIDDKSVGQVSGYTFEDVSETHTISVTFIDADGLAFPFKDVPANHWAREPVAYVYYNGLFAGTSKTTFSPDVPMSRGMLVTVLYAMEGKPSVSDWSDFDDVASKAYYADAVDWAFKNDIIRGYSDSKFGPDDAISREQLTTILYQYADFKDYDIISSKSLDTFVDEDSVSKYAVTGMEWALANDLISGKGNNILDPKGNATRAEVATIMTSFYMNIVE